MSGLAPGDAVAVVGAGAVGTTAAADLAARGVAVELFDRGEVASGSSGRAAGICYDAFAEDVDAAVADRAIERFRHVSSDDGDGFRFVECPYVWLAREGDDRRAEAIREGIAGMCRNGRDVERLDAAELGERYPGLRTDDVGIAGLAHDAGHCDPGEYVREMADRFERAGGRIREDAPVELERDPPGVRTPGTAIDADAVLVAAGAHTKRVLADAGVSIPMKPYRVQAMTAGVPGEDAGTDAAAGASYGGPMVYDATDGFYCRPHPEGLLAGNGTEEVEADPDDYDRAASEGFAADLADRVAERLRLAPTVERGWAGLCTATPDRDPLLGRIAEGVYVATGFQGHGFMRSPALGEAIAEAMLAGESAPIDPFDPERFEGEESFAVREGMVIED
jgi:glycine/D-amino acid oxidase-like deaminating enzyme